MHAFDYLSIFVSIVIALGVTHLLSNLARLIHLRDHVRLYAPALIWAFSLLLLQVQIWWASFYRRDIAEWTFLGFALYLVIPSIVAMLSYLALPELREGADLEREYNHSRQWFHGLLGAAIVVSLLEDAVRSGFHRFDANLAFRLIFLALALAGYRAQTRRGQLISSASFLAALVAYIAIVFSRL